MSIDLRHVANVKIKTIRCRWTVSIHGAREAVGYARRRPR